MNTAALSTLSFVLTGLWRATWQASALAVVVLVIQKMLGRRLGGRGRFALWAVVVARLLLPVLPQSRFSVFNLAKKQTHATSVSQPVVAPTREADIPIIVIHAPRSAKPQAAEVTPVVPVVEQSHGTNGRVWIFAAWLAGVITLSIRVAHVCWGLSRTIRKLTVVTDTDLLQSLRDCAALLHLRRIPQMLAGDDVQTPAVVGLLHSKLLLPSHVLCACDHREIRLILLHELAHLKRHDIAGNWLIALASVLHWFNPFVWLVSARMRADRELACDELVLSASQGEAQAYGRTLLKLIEILSPQSRSLSISPKQLAIVGILESTTPMQRRVRMIAQFAPQSSRRWIWTALVLGLLGCVTLTDAVRGDKITPASSQPSTQPALARKTIDASESDVRFEAALAIKLPALDLDAVPFEGAINLIRDKCGQNVVVNWRALEAAGIDRATQVTLHLKVVTVRQALDQILDQVGGGSVALGHTVDNGAILISTEEELAKHTKTLAYDVNDLIQPQTGESRQNAVDRLVKVIIDMVAPDTWKDNGGNVGSMQELNGKLVVQTTPAVQEKVAELLNLLRSEQRPAPAPAAPPTSPVVNGYLPMPYMNQLAQAEAPTAHSVVADEEIERANQQAMTLLKKKIPEVKFQSTPFSDTIDFLRDVTGANLYVNWYALNAAGIDKNTAVSLTLRDVSFSSALTAICRQVNSQRVAIVIDKGIITITTREDLPSYMLTKTYETRDLVGDNAKGMTSLIAVVQSMAPSQIGGMGVQAFGTKMIVTALPDAHEQLEKLLADLRQGSPKPATQPADATLEQKMKEQRLRS